jgi:hypothetical protein
MKYKLHLRTPAALFLIIVSIAAAAAQPAVGIATAIDPATGLPIAAPVREWKSSDWKEPSKVLPEVNFDSLPVSEVVRYLREQFSNDFDIVIPSTYTPVNSSPATGQELVAPSGQIVKLQLRNVTASEIFHAMNLQFEAQNNPVQWQLMMNGNRPTALLRIVPELLPHAPPPPPAPEIKRMVFFVGDLVGDEKTASMAKTMRMKSIVDTIARVWGESGLSGGHSIETTFDTVSAAFGRGSIEQVQIYAPAQLLIVTGTPDAIELAQQTLKALKQKQDWFQKTQSNSAEPNPKSPKSNSGASADSK